MKDKNVPRGLFLLLALLALTLASLAIGLLAGSAGLPAAEVWAVLTSQHPAPLAADIVWQLRWPRVLGGFACGGLLALSGVLLQVLLRNPLAEPYILGISGGASVGVLGAMLLGLSALALPLAALLGAMASVALLFMLCLGSGQWNIHRVLLTGVVMASGFGALISLILSLAPSEGLRGMLFWLMGDLSQAEHGGAALTVLLTVLVYSQWRAPALNVLSAGELKAKSLGVAVGPLQLGLYLTASLATAAAVMEGGAIGFVGLIVPHFLRLLGIADHRWLLSLSVLLGGSFLVLADTLARSAIAPQQLPVGVLTALLGVPALLFLLARGRHAAR